MIMNNHVISTPRTLHHAARIIPFVIALRMDTTLTQLTNVTVRFRIIIECSLNCGNCVGTKTNCTSCNPSQFKTFVNNNCICTGNRFLDITSNIDLN